MRRVQRKVGYFVYRGPSVPNGVTISNSTHQHIRTGFRCKMLFKNILLPTYAAVAGAFNIPDGTQDGIYEHYIDEKGVDVHVKGANATKSTRMTNCSKTRRP